jgi:hypothetical protein
MQAVTADNSRFPNDFVVANKGIEPMIRDFSKIAGKVKAKSNSKKPLP